LSSSFTAHGTKQLILTFLVIITFSTEKVMADSESWFRADIMHAGSTGMALIQAPLKFEQEEWRQLAGTVAITGLLFIADKQVKQASVNQQSSFNDKLFGIDRFHGSQYSLFTSLGIYGYGLAVRNDNVRQLGLRAAEAFVYSGAITNLLKMAMGRRRPFAGENQLVFKSFNAGTDNTYLSLPSGHTTAAFSVSTVLAAYSDNLAWKTFCYGSAVLVGAARIYHDRHWLSDVFLGGMIGYHVGKFVSNQDHRTYGESSARRFRPIISAQGVGLSFSF